MQTALTLQAVIHQLDYPGWAFLYRETNGVPYLQIECGQDWCNVTGQPISWRGRKWMLSFHMTDGEVVQTAFLAVMTALEHEAREVFNYKRTAVMDPHYDIDKLVELRQRHDALKEREAA